MVGTDWIAVARRPWAQAVEDDVDHPLPYVVLPSCLQPP
jgi:hypothetical protein